MRVYLSNANESSVWQSMKQWKTIPSISKRGAAKWFINYHQRMTVVACKLRGINAEKWRIFFVYKEIKLQIIQHKSKRANICAFFSFSFVILDHGLHTVNICSITSWIPSKFDGYNCCFSLLLHQPTTRILLSLRVHFVFFPSFFSQSINKTRIKC